MHHWEFFQYTLYISRGNRKGWVSFPRCKFVQGIHETVMFNHFEQQYMDDFFLAKPCNALCWQSMPAVIFDVFAAQRGRIRHGPVWGLWQVDGCCETCSGDDQRSAQVRSHALPACHTGSSGHHAPLAQLWNSCGAWKLIQGTSLDHPWRDSHVIPHLVLQSWYFCLWLWRTYILMCRHIFPFHSSFCHICWSAWSAGNVRPKKHKFPVSWDSPFHESDYLEKSLFCDVL